MRPIDADGLKEVFKEKSTEAVCGAELCKAIISRIDNQPTVKAIPIEYIESTMNRWKEIIGYEESVDALRILINNWKIEREEE